MYRVLAASLIALLFLLAPVSFAAPFSEADVEALPRAADDATTKSVAYNQARTQFMADDAAYLAAIQKRSQSRDALIVARNAMLNELGLVGNVAASLYEKHAAEEPPADVPTPGEEEMPAPPAPDPAPGDEGGLDTRAPQPLKTRLVYVDDGQGGSFPYKMTEEDYQQLIKNHQPVFLDALTTAEWADGERALTSAKSQGGP